MSNSMTQHKLLSKMSGNLIFLLAAHSLQSSILALLYCSCKQNIVKFKQYDAIYRLKRMEFFVTFQCVFWLKTAACACRPDAQMVPNG